MILKKIFKCKLLIFSIVSYIVLFIVNPDIGLNAIKNSAYYFKEMVEILPIVFVIISIIEAWIPKEVIIKGLGSESGLKGMGLSFALGSLSAGPLYAAFPLSKLLINKGASVENIVIIISAWAVIKVPMLVNEVKFIGFEFMVVRWILSVISIVVMGKAMALAVNKSDIRTDPVEIESGGINIKYDYCIGCGLCETILPEYFKVKDGKAMLLDINLDYDDASKLEEVIKKCPVNAVATKQLNN